MQIHVHVCLSWKASVDIYYFPCTRPCIYYVHVHVQCTFTCTSTYTTLQLLLHAQYIGTCKYTYRPSQQNKSRIRKS